MFDRDQVTEELSGYVDAGAEWLNREFPDWYHRIQLKRLRLNIACFCVLGQIHPKAEVGTCATMLPVDVLMASYSGYDAAVYEHGRDWVDQHGFSVKRGYRYKDEDEVWEILQSLWVEKILELRKKDQTKEKHHVARQVGV
jgi:hypothetical protein